MVATTITLPTDGDWNVTAVAVDTRGQYDFASTGATARYLSFPGDTPPTFNLGCWRRPTAPKFSDGKIFVSGRAEDTTSPARWRRSRCRSRTPPNQYMTSSGSFTAAPTWVTAFLTSPGTPGSNFSYTTPIVPRGQLHRPGPRHRPARPGDDRPAVRTVTVTHPANNKPVAVHRHTRCARRTSASSTASSSTDETPTTLTYAWNFGNNGPPRRSGGSATGPNPKKTFTAAGTYTVTLTVKDQWGLLSDPVTKR